MCAEEDFDLEGNYKKRYGFIFSFFYFWEGVHQAIPAILPYYFLFVFGSYDIALIAIISFFALLPWSLKLIVGLISDKWGSERWGRRFPFILIFGVLGGITWIIMTFTLPMDESIYSVIAGYLFIANLGIAFADTSLDGQILDVTPKDKLAKVQGYTWTMLMIGGAGAVAIALLLYYAGMVEIVFLITGIFLVISSILPYFVKEPPIKEQLNIASDLKRIVVEKKNYKVFSWTLITAIVYPMIMASFFYFMVISMGVVDVTTTNLSLEAGQTEDAYIILNIIIQGAAGIGIVLGSLIMGRIGDKSRKKAMLLTYSIYIPIILISNVFFGLVMGLIAHIIFGFVYGGITIAGQTIRGDIAKKNFPDLKSTYYALLISFSNFGQSIGSLLLGYLFSSVAPVLANFFLLYFFITVISAIIIGLSFLVFRTIKQEEYEFNPKIEVTSRFIKSVDG